MHYRKSVQIQHTWEPNKTQHNNTTQDKSTDTVNLTTKYRKQENHNTEQVYRHINPKTRQQKQPNDAIQVKSIDTVNPRTRRKTTEQFYRQG